MQILASVGHLLPVLHPCKQYPIYTKHGQRTLLPYLHLWMLFFLSWMLVFFCPAYISWLHVSLCPANTTGCSILLPCLYPWMQCPIALPIPLDAVPYCPAYSPGCSKLLSYLYPWMHYPIALSITLDAVSYSIALSKPLDALSYCTAPPLPLDAVSYCPVYTPGCSIILPCLYPWMQYPTAQ